MEITGSFDLAGITLTAAPPPQKLYVWGIGNSGAIGNNDTQSASSPVQVGTETTWQSTSSGGSGAFTMGIKNDNTLWTWGSNGYGQLGNGTGYSKSSPTQVGGTWTSCCAGFNSAFAIRTDGTLWSWGQNNEGQLGDGTTGYKQSPGAVGADTTWSKVRAGRNHTIAVKSDGTLWTWGNNGYGQLGNSGTGVSQSSPVQVAGTTWVDCAASDYASFATKSDGTLWAWGFNSSGQLGQNNTTDLSSPVQIAGTTWSKVFGADRSVFAIKTDNTLWAWGSAFRGVLGTNNQTDRSSPVQVGGSWSTVAANGKSSNYSMAGIKTDGTLWTWGSNSEGQLDNSSYGLFSYWSSPQQVGTAASWISVSMGRYFCSGVKSA